MKSGPADLKALTLAPVNEQKDLGRYQGHIASPIWVLGANLSGNRSVLSFIDSELWGERAGEGEASKRQKAPRAPQSSAPGQGAI